jgi:hypothetical protein
MSEPVVFKSFVLIAFVLFNLILTGRKCNFRAVTLVH